MSRVKKGFTLVELSLSMAFIALLSLIMVVIITNAVSSYRRGLTLDLINTTGMDLVEEFRTAVQGSPARSLKEECSELYSAANPLRECRADNGKSLAVVTRYGNVRDANDTTTNLFENIPIYGAICTGKYTYVWNSGYFMNNKYAVYVGEEQRETGMKIEYSEGIATTGLEKLLKFDDEDKAICRAIAGYRAGKGTEGDEVHSYKEGIYRTYEQIKNGQRDGEVDGADIDSDEISMVGLMYDGEPEVLLKSDKYNNLALYDLTTAVPAKALLLNDMFYSMSFILGTLQGGADVKVAGGNCKPPESAQSEFDYCAINKFNFAAQASGG